jgi:hypothetical protein
LRRVRLLEAAKQEALDAAAWYEYERAGLGQEFLLALGRVLDLLEQDVVPLTGTYSPSEQLDVARLLLHRFPYSVVIAKLPMETLVVAVAHQSRRPGYWRNRLDDHNDA